MTIIPRRNPRPRHGFGFRLVNILTPRTPRTTPTSPKREDATVYGSEVVLRALPGHPQFQGVLDGPAGPMVRLQDGPLVLRIADLPALDLWVAELERARVHLTQHRGRLAAATARSQIA
ncbi:hypothetical protein [Actinomadura litoris]|uniref:Uncharacterized protein n=1 Tax=Actinomadura litoris TaxID=2678616 RepID=A0A7K1LAN1_9ACTN|nr:hypothetical protein [Actinomadura litoris]MUN41491.1 hypothetical protein [Actinomadura litoris]